MNIYQVTTRPRHRRYMYFVDDQYSGEELLKIILANQSWWGGRYNPIVPVKDGVPVKGYLDIIKHYDPDVIFHSSNVNPEMIQKLRLFNPSDYYNLDEKPFAGESGGVNTFYMLSELSPNAKVMIPAKIWPSDSVLPSFYELNFGLSITPYHHEYEMSKNYQQLKIDNEAFKSLNKTIHLEKPVNIAALAKSRLNTKILRSLANANYDDFELIIAKDATSSSDLLYYWNRGLFQHKNLVYVTVQQLEELCKDKFFGGVLHDLQGDHSIRVVSLSLSEAEIDDLIRRLLRPIAFNSNYRYFNISHFPYEVTDGGGLYDRNYGESVSTQTLVSDQGLIQVPKLSFGGTPVYSTQSYAIDLTITHDRGYQQTEMLFPLTTETRHIVRDIRGRINFSRKVSLFINSQQFTSDVFKIHVPDFSNLARQLICQPVVQGKSLSNKILDIGPHDASNRLNAFIQTFKGDFSTIQDFFSDKFWVDIFEELSISERLAGNTITFAEIIERAVNMYKVSRLGYIVKGRGWFNIDNLSLGLKATLTELTEYQVFFKGYRLKCPKCSSVFWYHIDDVKNSINCSGCRQRFDLPVEPQFAYKLNDLIKNNIFQTKSNRDGNLTVIRSLAVFSGGFGAFQYSPQINVYDDLHSRKPCGDLDLFFSENGKLVIGEAKYQSSAFFAEKSKSLIGLVETAKLIFPDKVVLACSVDDNGKLEKAKASLHHLFNKWAYEPQIEILKLRAPDYWHIKSHRYFKY